MTFWHFRSDTICFPPVSHVTFHEQIIKLQKFITKAIVHNGSDIYNSVFHIHIELKREIFTRYRGKCVHRAPRHVINVHWQRHIEISYGSYPQVWANFKQRKRMALISCLCLVTDCELRFKKSEIMFYTFLRLLKNYLEVYKCFAPSTI